MRKIRILHIHTLPVISGSGINTLLSMAKIDLSRYTPELACAPKGRLIELVKSYGFKVRRIKNFARPISPLKDIMAVFELAFLLKKERYDIVHTHNSKAGFIGRLAAKIACIPVVVHTVHGFAFHPYENLLRRCLFVFLERLASHWCDKMIFISGALIDWAIKERIAPYEKMLKIYSGLELEDFYPRTDSMVKRKELGIDEDDLVIGQIAKLWKGKGQKFLLQATSEIIKDIPNIKVILVGEGELEEELKNLARKLNIEEKVIFTGFRTDIPQITAILDIVCLPSLWEGMGRSALEAMVCGKPVVATKVGGIVDLVEDGVTGFLVPPADSKALAEALIRLLKDRELRERMGQAGRRKVDARFSAQKMAEEIQNLYDELLREKGLIR